MATYIQVTFHNVKQASKEILLARLIELGFDGFEEGHNHLIAAMPLNNFNQVEFDQLVAEGYSYSIEHIEERNWNEEWETSFQPVRIDDFVAIRASFQPTISDVQHEIVITPKMSFGTGHHATTYLMIQCMKRYSFVNKTIADFGTGTGVLAILGSKLGASGVVAIDNDAWSITNATENINANQCSEIIIRKDDKLPPTEKFDIILANINKNTILAHMSSFEQQLHDRGVLIVSGFLISDQLDVMKEARLCNFSIDHRAEKDSWSAFSMVKS